MLNMSKKTIPQFCAICHREKQPSNGLSRAYSTPLFEKTTPSGISLRHKYGNLPSKKNDDFFTQVTEPQWLRRGNLKESDCVCKRHLAILMRGVDRGCEGGCSSPLHRGARLCKSESLKTIPPTWRRLFMRHPQIKDEDKELMLFCWDCYKKHMSRMSRYGDPMGTRFGKKVGLQRSNSLIDGDVNGNGILQSMKKYKSMERLDYNSVSISCTSTAYTTGAHSRRKSSSSVSQGDKEDAVLENDKLHESQFMSSRRTNRGRRSLKGKRSPSPPNNISPVRTSVVHSKRKHSPHKSPKSLSVRCSSNLTTTSHEVESNVTSVETTSLSRLSVDDTEFVDLKIPGFAPVSPVDLPETKKHSSDEAFDVLSGSRDFKPNLNFTDCKEESLKLSELTSTLTNAEFHRSLGSNFLPNELENTYSNKISHNELNANHENPVVDDTQSGIFSNQTGESTTSADELAGIFSNSTIIEDINGLPNGNETLIELETDTLHIPLIEFDNIRPDMHSSSVDHQHESSGSSSDKTGVTQIENKLYVPPTISSILFNENVSITEPVEFIDFERDFKNPTEINTAETTEHPETNQIKTEAVDMVVEDSSNMIKTVLESSISVSPPKTKGGACFHTDKNSILNNSLSPKAFRKLAASTLQILESVGPPRHQRSNLFFRDDVSEQENPTRLNVFMKIPRDLHFKTHMSDFIRIPAENVEIFSDTMSYLDGITKTVAGDVSMLASGELNILSVDLKQKENRTAHRTLEYSDDLLILRRGQPFDIELELSQNFEENHHNIVVELLIGNSPRVSNCTHLFLPVKRSNIIKSEQCITSNSGGWYTRLVESCGKLVKIAITPPFVCAIGSYSLCFRIQKDDTESRWNCGTENCQSFKVLFNPWCIDDAVFMSSQSDRTEYVTTDSGCIYSGNESSLIPIPCVFGQHEMGVLEACIELLDSCNLPTAKKGDPVSVTRAICRRIANIINTTPTKMTQSHYGGVFNTLRNFMKIGMLDIPDNLNSTAILVTVFRCLGLPSRSVTGINCAVETDLPMTVNVHYNDEGYSLDYLNNDKIWPSVSWVGVWMSRVDLPPGFGGWQEIMLRQSSLGPIPVYAIKKGQTYCCEGTQEHFFTLNADTKHWVVSKDGNMALMKIQQRAAGLSIFTKAVGSMEPQDITKLYKFSEGCEEQKLAIHTAYMHCGRQNVIDESEMKNGDTKITLSTNPPVINFGNDVDVITKITNSSDFVRHLTVNLCGTVVAQDGTPIMKLQKETILAEVLENESVDIPVKFNLGPYLHKLSPNCHLLFTAFGKIRELEEQYNIATHYVGIKYPEIEIQIHGEFKVAGELTIVSRIRNPLPNLLLNSKLILTTSGLTPLHIVTNSGKSVGPWQVFKTERLYRCQRPGKHTIVASFTSDRMTGLMGIQDINIAC